MQATEEYALKQFLDNRILLYNTPAFIAADPISIPHRFSKKQDIEIAGFFAATLAWGNRTTIINNCSRLLAWMNNSPHEFVLNHQPEDRKPMLDFAHRTFNATDLLYFIETLQRHYRRHDSLEDAFNLTPGPSPQAERGEGPERRWRQEYVPKYSVAQLKQFEFARMNRKAATDAEDLLWQNLRGNKLEAFKFRRQHPIDSFVTDFVCLEKRLIVEVDGGYHATSEQQEYDKYRTGKLRELGFEELRFSNEEVLTNISLVLATIRKYIAAPVSAVKEKRSKAVS